MRNKLAIAVSIMAVLVVAAGTALAQSGHFITRGGNAVICTDIGTQVTCSGKVAGLGGSTFEIHVAAEGVAEVECINPGGNRAPGQDTEVTTEGTTDPLPTPRNGQYRFSITTDSPDPLPSVPTCPNAQWTARVVDVQFTTATISLFEDGVLSDQVTVPVE